MPAGRENGHVDDPDLGRWLLLRDAVREIGSLEALYRLAADGTLQAREDPEGRVEVWVTTGDHFGDPPTRSPEAARPAEAAVPDSLGPSPSEVGRYVAALMAPLTESHERNLQLARENGALSERVPALERELQALRASSVADKHALEAVQQRLDNVVEASITMTDLLHSRTFEREWEQLPARGRGRSLWALLMIGFTVAVAAVLAVVMAVGAALITWR